jgi:hypothetical protein
MKKIPVLLTMILFLPVLLQAQYSGGSGRGDVISESLNILLPDGYDCNDPIPALNVLQQNYPNPFSKATTIKFNVPGTGNVKIVLYDVIGCEVQILLNESLKPGKHSLSFDGSLLKSGMYFYKISAGDYSETRRMMLNK